MRLPYLYCLVFILSLCICHTCMGVIIPHTAMHERHRQKAMNYIKFPELAAVGKLSITKDGGKREICTGTLLTKRHVITAGHCVYHAKKVTFTLVKKNGQEINFRADKFSYNPRYITAQGVKDNSHDIGIVTLSQEVQEPIFYPKLYSKSWKDLNKEINHHVAIRSVGFGITGQATVSQGTKKISPPGMKMALKTFLKPYQNKRGQKYLVSTFLNPTKQIWSPLPTTYGAQAPGDSGSPNFMKAPNNHLVLIATHAMTVKKGELSTYEESSYKATIPENIDYILKAIALPVSQSLLVTRDIPFLPEDKKTHKSVQKDQEYGDSLEITVPFLEKTQEKKKVAHFYISHQGHYILPFLGFLRVNHAVNKGKMSVSGRFDGDFMTSKGDIHIINGGYFIIEKMMNEGSITVQHSRGKKKVSFYQSYQTTIKGGRLLLKDGIANVESLFITHQGNVQLVSKNAELNGTNIVIEDGSLILAHNPHVNGKNIYIEEKGQLVITQGYFSVKPSIILMLAPHLNAQKPYILIQNSLPTPHPNKDLVPHLMIGLNQQMINSIKTNGKDLIGQSFLILKIGEGGKYPSSISPLWRPQIVLQEKSQHLLASQNLGIIFEFYPYEIRGRIVVQKQTL